MRRLAAAAFAFALAAAPAAARADLFSSVSYGAHVSTIGDGVTLEKPLLYDLSVRLTTNAGSTSQQLTFDGNPYTSTQRAQNVGVIADFRPYGGRYRISGGLLFGNDRVDNVARDVGGSYRIGAGTYPVSAAGRVTATMHYDRPAIYLGAGTGTGLVPGLALAFDAGIVVRNGHASAGANGPLANDPAFRADLARLQGELRPHVVQPVVSIGLVFRP